MLSIRDQMIKKYEGKEAEWKEIMKRYGSMPYEPTAFSFWYLFSSFILNNIG